ncbi:MULTISPECIES: DUF368 domain-containing protein [unclassified Thermosipho (in: thermotogales)]|uniref:DUF368 domain-containing protein n=1 Tax=unclassified Thermosipho (in: thermotogales) TaxID=2676525 RepID=UPI0009878FA4|nr:MULTISPECIES: DUF368 domain-containing protein [unclassified Thermosipho (in: thermotogales)]MBT1247285.1 hypothetical protein [Thermosipho sp. 1244]OOC47140.1 hypothetical protein XO09_02980 [Thermosipho sp. 1223]
MRDFLLGILMGIANLLPGISGGTIAAISGRYDIILKAFSDLLSFKLKKNSLKTVVFLVFGIAISILLLSKILSKVFEKYPEYSYGLFSGLIIGGLFYLLKEVKVKKISNFSIITFSFASTYFILSFTQSVEKSNTNLFYLFIGGIIGAATMVLPGISGSSMLLILGIYKQVIDAISSLDFRILIPFGLGVLLGLILIVKLLEILMEKFREKVISFLIGLTLAGTILIFPVTTKWFSYVYFVLGILISKYLEAILKE